MYNTLSEFYTSKDWKEFRQTLIAERIQSDGFVHDAITGKPIVKSQDIIAHHVEPLTLDNVNDCTIALNPNNIQLVSFRTHNELHDRYGVYTRHVYIVYGAPLSGKTTFVAERAGLHDIIIDLDKIYACITNNPMHIKSGRISDNAFAVRDCLYDQIKTKRGRWVNAWVIAGLPYKGERERLSVELGAECIYMDCDKETALSRLQVAQDGRNIADYTKYINQYYSRYQE